MTLQFPSSPINGAVSGEYTYDAAKGAWRKNAALPVSVTHSDVAPSNPRVGDQWWKSNEGTLFTYYNDGTSSQWVESTNVVANVEPNPIPAGAMMAWASDVVPANWLLCDGSAVSRSTYASLFASIGTTYGSGDGTTTFNLPNIKGRTIVGKDSAQTEFDTFGETGGAKTHTLTSSEMPNHTHSFSGTTSTTGSHNHINGWASITGYNYVGSGGNSNWPFGGGSNAAQRDLQAAGDHSHTFSGTTGAAGSGSAHNNLQPYIVLNYIIKFSAGETPGDSQLAVRVGTLETQNNATPLSPNYIINGGFDFWQRGTSFTSIAGGTYTADRWATQPGMGAQTVTQVTDTPGGYSSSLRLQRSSVVANGIVHRIESANSASLVGKIVTVSYWAKTASVGQTIRAALWYPSATDNFATVTNSQSLSANVTSSWARYSFTFTALSSVFSAGLELRIGSNSAAVDTHDLYIAGVQLEEGSMATPFRRNAPSIQAELATCQRYYYQSAQAYGFYNIFNSGNMQSTTFRFPVTMRSATPTVTVYDNAGTVNRITIANTNGTSQNGITPPASVQYTADGFMWIAGGIGGTPGTGGMVYMSRFDASAEL